MVRDPNYWLREGIRHEERPEFERKRIRWLLHQEFKNTTPDAHKAISLMDEALRLKDSPGGAKQAYLLALEAYDNADQDRNVRYNAINILNTYARQLLDAGMPTAALNHCRLMESLDLVDGFTHRHFAVAYHNLGHPDEAILKIEQAMQEAPDQVWFHIVAAECYVLKALQQRFIYSNKRQAQESLYRSAEQLGRAYSRGDEEIQEEAAFFLTVIMATKLANDWTQLLGGLGQLGKSMNLDQQARRELRELISASQYARKDAQDEVDRLRHLVRSSKPHQKELLEVYEEVMYPLRGGPPPPLAIEGAQASYQLNSPKIQFSCPDCGQVGHIQHTDKHTLRLQCEKCGNIFSVTK